MRSSVTGDHKGNKAPLYPSQPPSPLQSYPSAGYEVRSATHPGRPQGSPLPYTVNPQSQSHSQIQGAGTSSPAPFNAVPASTDHLFWQSQDGFTFAPSEGWLAMVLLTIAVYSVVLSIISINQVEHGFILLASTAIGLFVGLLVAKLRHLPQVIMHLGACLLGHWLSVFFVSALAFHVPWLELLGDLRAVIAGGITNATAPGEMVFLFYLCFLSFFLGYFGAWLIYRAHLPWLVALVYCSILLINLGYAKQDQSLLVVILLSALILLIARIQLAKQLAAWTSEGLHTDRRWLQNITTRFIRVSAVLMVIALLVSLILPAVGQPASGLSFWDNLNNFWTNITHGQLSFQNLDQPYQAPANFFGDSLSITGNVSLPDGEVLSYTTTATQPQYLEGFTFDRFDGHTWTSVVSNLSQKSYLAGAPIPPDLQGDSNQVTTIVTIKQPPEGPKHYIFAPYEPTSFDVDTVLYGTTFTSAWTQPGPLAQGEQYRVVSLIPAATAPDLSGVPLPLNDPNTWSNDSNYPALQDYLQTPADLSSTVLNTARQWTKGAANAYQAVEMLQNHLNDTTQFKYATSNPPVPANVDAVTWLLQTHQGYCTYYATAMTIMARLLDIPARVVNGFNSGQFDAQRKVWVVKGSDAHSWVQVYFPGYGWISFDPTPGFTASGAAQPQPSPSPVPTQRPTKPTPTTSSGSINPPSTPDSPSRASGAQFDERGRWSLLLELSLALLFCLLLALFIAIFRYRRVSLATENSLVSRMYWRVCRLATWAGLAPQGWQTPYEFSRALVRHFPQVTAPMRRLTDLYVRERWAGPRGMPHPTEQADLERLWPHLRRALLRLFFLRFRRGRIKAR